MNTIKLSREKVEELIEGIFTQQIDEYPTKHDYRKVIYVSQIDGKDYRFDLDYSYNEGLVTFDYVNEIEAVEVRPVEVKKTEWKVVD